LVGRWPILPIRDTRGFVVQELVSLLPIFGIALLFWLLIIRPQSKRQEAVRTMQSALEPGTEVMLTSGVYGTLDRVEDDTIWVRVAEGVVLKVAKGAVGNVVHPEPAADPAGPPDEPTTPSQDR
jgi:preprotein translocase subunit YajC